MNQDIKNHHSHHIREIHKKMRKHSPHSVKKVKKIFKFKYPKLLLFLLAVIVSYLIFRNGYADGLMDSLGNFSYFGMFIAGILTSLGFSAPFGIGFLIVLHPPNIFIAAVIAGFGAMFADMLLFKFIKFSFMNEIEMLEKTAMKDIRKIIHKNIRIKINNYLLYIFAGIIISTPLPDEIGITMIAGLTSINPKIMAIMSFILHTLFMSILLLAVA